MSAAASESKTERSASASPHPGLFAQLFESTPIAPLVQFRIALGLILLWEAYRYIASGWSRTLFLDRFPETPALDRPFLFHYYGFEWVEPLPPALHLALFPILAVLAVFVACGMFYRLSTGLLFAGWAYVFLLDQSLYLNHLYLVTLIIGLATLLPANRALSLDVWMRPTLAATVVPRWTLTLLRCQVGIVYFFGGIAKLEGDWLSGVPMQMMLLERADLIDQPAGEPAVALFFAWSGLLLDLLAVPLLWWKRSRLVALLLIAGFHLTNHVLFQIGIFPWFMMAATLILWPPYPLSLLSFSRIYGALVGLGMLLTLVAGRAVPLWSWGVAVVAGLGLVFPPAEWKRLDPDPRPDPDEPPVDAVPPRVRPVVLALLGVYLGWQCLMPLRHFLYPGSPNWTEQGHKWAWHMKLRIKYPDPQFTRFYVLDEDGAQIAEVDPFAPDGPLTFRQARTMATRPDLILQFAHHLRDEYAAKTGEPVTVRANIRVSLNGREPAHLIDPEANLAAIEPRLWPPADWILPLTVPRWPLERVDVERFLAERPPVQDAVETDDL
ncbi:MAG: HTTM domain-containing protein [Planctomycetaceae bacterium]